MEFIEYVPLIITGLLLLFIFLFYVVYRFYAMFSLAAPQTINRILRPKIHDKFSIISDGLRVQSQILDADSKTDFLFFVVHSLNTKKEDFQQLAKVDTKHKHTIFLWTIRNFAPNMTDNKFQIETFSSDILDLTQALREKFPSKKIIFVGEGFGAMLLTDFMKRYPGINDTSKFILINLFPNYQSTLFNFFERIPKNWIQFFYGILSHRKLPINVVAQFNPTVDGETFLKTIPVFFFGSFVVLRKKIIKNILSNKKSDIFITFSEKDQKSSWILLRYKSRFSVTNPNIRFKANPHLDLTLSKNATKREQFFTLLLKDFNSKTPY